MLLGVFYYGILSYAVHFPFKSMIQHTLLMISVGVYGCFDLFIPLSRIGVVVTFNTLGNPLYIMFIWQRVVPSKDIHTKLFEPAITSIPTEQE